MTSDSPLSADLASCEDGLFSLLERLVTVQSGSHNKHGVDQVADLVQSEFSDMPVSCQRMDQRKWGDHLVVRTPAAAAGEPKVLVVGHMDTVFPKETAFTEYREDRERAYGPGVIDMKGGLVAGIFALKALDRAGLLTALPLTFVFNSDEEVGSPSSRDLIRKEARRSVCAFVLEAAGIQGEVVTARKGNLSFTMTTRGVAGHAAFAGSDKSSAILEMAHHILALEALNDPDAGISVNVGTIQGGMGANTIPPDATADVDVRFRRAVDGQAVQQRIKQILDRRMSPNGEASYTIRSTRPAMPEEANLSLFDAVAKTARRLGIVIQKEFRAGVSDANLVAAEGTPVLDGLGPAGGRDHSPDEYMLKATLLPRTQLLAEAILDCWREFG